MRHNKTFVLFRPASAMPPDATSLLGGGVVGPRRQDTATRLSSQEIRNLKNLASASRNSRRRSVNDTPKSMTRSFRNLNPLARMREHLKLKLDAFEAISPLGAYCSSADIRLLARACSIRTFGHGQELWDSPFYLVLQGLVSVKDETGAVLCIRKEGTFFSRHASLTQSRLVVGNRSGAMVLLVTNEGRLEEFHEGCSAIGKEGYDALVSTDIAAALSTVPFIKEAQLDAVALRKLGELCSYSALAEGWFRTPHTPHIPHTPHMDIDNQPRRFLCSRSLHLRRPICLSTRRPGHFLLCDSKGNGRGSNPSAAGPAPINRTTESHCQGLQIGWQRDSEAGGDFWLACARDWPGMAPVGRRRA